MNARTFDYLCGGIMGGILGLGIGAVSGILIAKYVVTPREARQISIPGDEKQYLVVKSKDYREVMVKQDDGSFKRLEDLQNEDRERLIGKVLNAASK